MTFDFIDAWILQAIYNSEKNEQGANLVDIIAYGDYSNHAIISYAELFSGLSKLIDIGLVIQLDKVLITSNTFKNWLSKKYQRRKRIYIQRELSEIETYVNKTFATYERNKVEQKIVVTEEDYKRAVDDYINMADKIFGELK